MISPPARVGTALKQASRLLDLEATYIPFRAFLSHHVNAYACFIDKLSSLSNY